MRKRTRWQAHEVGHAMNLATSFERCLANRNWCTRYHPALDQEAARWHTHAKDVLLTLRRLGLPDEILQGLIGYNHSFEEFGLKKEE